jgi:hypothetical protein
MKVNKWTVGLAAAGFITLTPAILAQTTPTPAPSQVPLLTSLSATTISGYVDTSAVWNPGTGNANPAPYAFNAGKQDGFNLNAVDVKIAKPQDTTGWSAGYVAELSYGPDASAIDGGAAPIRQAYVALHMPVGNGIDWELGRWDNLLGYESSDSYKDPNYTRSYAYSFEPTEHTGLLGSYSVNSTINIQAGVADTVNTEPTSVNLRTDPGSGAIETKKSLVSLLTLTAPDSWGAWKGSALYAGLDFGEGNSYGVNSLDASTGHDRTELYIGTTVNTPIKDLTFGASWDWIHHPDFVVPAASGTGTIDARYEDSVAVYVSYKATDKLTFNGRAEYANGMGLAGLTLENDNVPTPAFNKVAALTGTVQYDLWANVVSRLEIRWDHAADGSKPFGGGYENDGTPDVPDKRNEVMLAANVIYKF